ncbi:MAG TPA: SEC-C metal-binding domain-containing protein [Planctomycetota bacterium]|nr:SEC-C metal-binding domain-containing protein [Planctomycetota bacterium]HRR78952.1 SEC-C metal-binding domain-containing protein [Planctomycetota bacterium]HRT92770.1 SEC-C metal-binding domain-containing protein [Planctomycetota bacterium]
MPNEITDALPWEDLQHVIDAEIPWDALKQFADALAAHPPLWDELRDLYETFMERPYERCSYVCCYVPAIVALAAPRLAEPQRQAIARFLLEELFCASDRDDEVMLDVLGAAAASLGPCILPAVLEALDRRRRYFPGAFTLWELAELAVKCDDASLREQVAQYCMRALERAEARKMDPVLASCPAWTLAKMKRLDALPLLQRVYRVTRDPDTRDALLLMRGKLDYEPSAADWDQPVETWLETNHKHLREWYESRLEERARGWEEHDEEEGDEDLEEEDWADDEPDEEADDWTDDESVEPFAPALPVRSPHGVGRNDPCPCGSGKKFKKCCAKKGASQ